MEKELYLYNTASRKKELFTNSNGKVGLYCCGPTVYNYAHIGNLRTYIFEDVLKRTLLSLGYKVKHVVNITDVGHLTSDADTGEDKIEKGARREGRTVWEIAEFYRERFMENIRDLNILSADIWPKATDHISEMIELVRKLEEKGFTYRTDDGIYFDTAKFPTYCDFARLDPNSLKAGLRVAVCDKKNSTDFALWKFSPKDVKRKMEWDSPWGVGFPGWHIECSAMSLKYLAQPVDIHCGGIDHIRIHHTNEIAQVEAATGKQYVRFWMHGEFMKMYKDKMSKSTENFVTLDILKEKKISPLAYRLFCYSAHYRSPLTFSWEGVQSAELSLKNLRNLVVAETADTDDNKYSDSDVQKILNPFWKAVYDDLNIPRALASIWDILHNSQYSSVNKKRAIEEADTLLALELFSKVEKKILLNAEGENGKTIWIISLEQVSDELIQKIVKMAHQRSYAREKKDFAQADRIRNDLKKIGVEIRDLPDGVMECDFSGS